MVTEKERDLEYQAAVWTSASHITFWLDRTGIRGLRPAHLSTMTLSKHWTLAQWIAWLHNFFTRHRCERLGTCTECDRRGPEIFQASDVWPYCRSCWLDIFKKLGAPAEAARMCPLGPLDPEPGLQTAEELRMVCRQLLDMNEALLHQTRRNVWRGSYDDDQHRFRSTPLPTVAGVIIVCVQLLSANEEVLRQTLGNFDANKYAFMITDHFGILVHNVLQYIIREDALRLEPCLETAARSETPADVIAAIFQIAAFDTSLVEEALGHGPEPVHRCVRGLLKMLWHWHQVVRMFKSSPRRLSGWDLEHFFHMRDRFYKGRASIMREEWTLPPTRSVHDDSD